MPMGFMIMALIVLAPLFALDFREVSEIGDCHWRSAKALFILPIIWLIIGAI